MLSPFIVVGGNDVFQGSLQIWFESYLAFFQVDCIVYARHVYLLMGYKFPVGNRLCCGKCRNSKRKSRAIVQTVVWRNSAPTGQNGKAKGNALENELILPHMPVGGHLVRPSRFVLNTLYASSLTDQQI
ncbi:MAG: hypothetical protein D6814_12135 [Calditrichaeota bacterium]|nr:MAG: hypothetical protein D6814_12135 [Calditrichota bacterium]